MKLRKRLVRDVHNDEPREEAPRARPLLIKRRLARVLGAPLQLQRLDIRVRLPTIRDELERRALLDKLLLTLLQRSHKAPRLLPAAALVQLLAGPLALRALLLRVAQEVDDGPLLRLLVRGAVERVGAALEGEAETLALGAVRGALEARGLVLEVEAAVIEEVAGYGDDLVEDALCLVRAVGFLYGADCFISENFVSNFLVFGTLSHAPGRVSRPLQGGTPGLKGEKRLSRQGNNAPLVPSGHCSSRGTLSAAFLFSGLQMSTVYVVLLWLGGSLSVVTTECGPPSFSRLKSCLSTRIWSQLSMAADARAARSDSSSLTCILGTVTELHAGAKMIVVFRDGGVAVELRDGGDRLKRPL